MTLGISAIIFRIAVVCRTYTITPPLVADISFMRQTTKPPFGGFVLYAGNSCGVCDFLRRRFAMKPIPAKPASIIA
jgi:hypothetical protein